MQPCDPSHEHMAHLKFASPARWHGGKNFTSLQRPVRALVLVSPVSKVHIISWISLWPSLLVCDSCSLSHSVQICSERPYIKNNYSNIRFPLCVMTPTLVTYLILTSCTWGLDYSSLTSFSSPYSCPNSLRGLSMKTSDPSLISHT